MTIYGPTSELRTFAFLDDGSTITLVNANVARAIGTCGSSVMLSLTGINPDNVLRTKSERVSFQICGSGETYLLAGVHTVEDLALPRQSIEKDLIDRYIHLQEIESNYYYDASPSLLIGQDNAHLLLTLESREGGPNKSSSKSVPRSRQVFQTKHDDYKKIQSQNDDDLHQIVHEYFRLDAIGVSSALRISPDENRARQLLESTTRKIENMWETGLLWKSDNIQFSDSRAAAMNRLKNLETKLDRDPHYAGLYYAEMSRFIRLGYAERVSETESSDRTWYLPHFGVMNPNKPNKVRLVFDAAAKVKGVSLNDRLLTGPDLLQSLLGVLMRFRQGKIGYKGDFRDMFLRIKLRSEDRDAQRFLWRGSDRKTEPLEYRMSMLLFGSKSSPCSALFVKNENANKFSSIFPIAAEKIKKQTYMDDLLDSCDNWKEAAANIAHVREINRNGGFEMHDWASNDERVLNSIPKHERPVKQPSSHSCCLSLKEKVLGLRWETQSDSFRFNIKKDLVPRDIANGSRNPTKREFLRVVMSVFDPIGFLAPLIIRSKILMQKIWVSGIGWNEHIRDEEQELWAMWLSDLQKVKEMSIPRWYSIPFNKKMTVELHIFCDAGSAAYAAVGYWRCEINKQKCQTSFVIGKSRVAPLKPTSIPRLELQAALIGSRLAQIITREHDIEITKRTFWTDSLTVLSQIKSDARTFQTFVSHRLAEIGELTSPSEWRWVPSGLNPADLATKTLPFDSATRDRWLKGPEFLYLHESEWPTCPSKSTETVLETTVKESRKTFMITNVSVATISVPDSATATVLVALERFRGSLCTQIESRHMDRAEQLRVRSMQAQSFADEIGALKSNRQLNVKSSILKLTPKLESCGILRLKGRIENTLNDEFNNNLAILDGSHPEVRLLVSYYHKKMNHSGHETVVNEIRVKFWVTKLRSTLRSVVAKCPICRMARSKPQQPLMSNLPPARLAFKLRPFSNCGVDYFGPIMIKIGRRREKHWGILFTCLTIRAIHVELANSLTADSAIMAIRRMAARRGQPTAFYSDNGTNFRAADFELRNAVLALDKNTLVRYAVNNRSQWHFIPPSTPHMGGAWERLIRSVKSALGIVLKETVRTEETLLTILLEIEHVVNSRPLTHVSPDPRDHQALTPNHFLIGSSSGTLALPRFEIHEKCARKQWRMAQILADAFWKRWVKEYLPSLLPRPKWLREEANLAVGDHVIVIDYTMPRNNWRKGIVQEVLPGPDGRVRVVRVKTANGVILRSSAKLIWFAKAN